MDIASCEVETKQMNFSNASILVIGDVMLDRYWFGDASRLSPEAPVPVVNVRRQRDTAGGAANVAINAANLGVRTGLLSVIGKDVSGDTLINLVQEKGVRPEFLRDENFQTIMKLRIIARNQQIVRADFEERPETELLLPLVDRFKECLADYQTLIFSDYGKGGLAHLHQMMKFALAENKKVLIDPKGSDYSAYHGATIITPNREEFALVAGHWHNEAEFERKAFALREHLDLASLLVTRSEEGMSLFIDGKHIRIPAEAREVFDVSGAGDTVIATLAAGLGAGLDLEEAARLANRAASIVVGKVGTTPITLEELTRA